MRHGPSAPHLEKPWSHQVFVCFFQHSLLRTWQHMCKALPSPLRGPFFSCAKERGAVFQQGMCESQLGTVVEGRSAERLPAILAEEAALWSLRPEGCVHSCNDCIFLPLLWSVSGSCVWYFLPDSVSPRCFHLRQESSLDWNYFKKILYIHHHIFLQTRSQCCASCLGPVRRVLCAFDCSRH